MGTFDHVHPGQPLGMAAGVYNAMVDAARAHRQAGMMVGGPAARTMADHDAIWVRNNTGSALAQFSAVAIGTPIIVPGDNESEFKQRVTFEAGTPAAGDRGEIAVVIERIPAGKIGRAVKDGVVQCKVNVLNANDQYADLTPGQVYLTSTRGYGEVRMLWKASGTGQQWAVVQLGHRVGAVAWGKIVADGADPVLYQADGTAWTQSDGYPVYAAVNPCSADGLNPVTSVTLYVRLPDQADRETAAATVVAYLVAQDPEGITIGGGTEYLAGYVIEGVNLDQGLPILTDDPCASVHRRMWMSATEPDTAYGYTTGWEIDSAFAGKFPVGHDSEDADFDPVGSASGGKQHSHTGSTGGPDDYVNVQSGAGGQPASSTHTHNVTVGNADPDHLPPFLVVNWIKWVGL